MRSSKWMVWTLLGAVLIVATAGSAVPVNAARSVTQLRTKLSGGAIDGLTPSGHAKFRERGTARRFNAEVEDVNLAPGTVLHVFVNTIAVGTITLSGAPVRGGELELNTHDGDAVIDMNKGDMVTVTDPAGNPILSGTF